MISAFWEELFRYGDWLTKNGKTAELKVLNKVQHILQKVYDRSLALESPERFDKRKAANELEKLVANIPEVTYLHDPTDNSHYYKYNTYRYNKPQEVIADILKERNAQTEEQKKLRRTAMVSTDEAREYKYQLERLQKQIKHLEAVKTQNDTLAAENKKLKEELERTVKDYDELADFVKYGGEK